jgi:hypothetical protein
MAKSITQINKEAGVNDTESTPAVVAYRVAQLENTQREGFRILTQKLDEYVAGFVSEKEYAEAKLEAKAEHERLRLAIENIKKSARWWLGIAIASATAIGTIIGALWWVPHR